MVEPKTDYEIELLNAVKEGSIGKIKELLGLNLVKLNGRRYFDYYLIIEALDSHRNEIAKLLIEKGFRVYKRSKLYQERTVLHAAIQSRDQELLTTLLAKGASQDVLALVDREETPLHLAIDTNKIKTPSYPVMDINQMSTIELLLSQFDAKAFDKNDLLHYAIRKDDVQVVSKLIAKGLSLTKKNGHGLTPFCVAMASKNFEIFDCLLSHHTVKNVKQNDHDDIAPAYVAIIHGNLKAIKKYVDCGLSVNVPLKWSTSTWSCLSNWLPKPGNTLLHFAVKLVKVEIVKYLLSIGADITVKNENGSSPLHIAFEVKEIGIWKTWQDFHDNNSIIDVILKAHTNVNSNPLNKRGLSHFHIACSRDDPTVIEYFLKFGVSINQPVKSQCLLYKNFSPLHFAAKFRCRKSLEVLLKNGADVKQRCYKKITALHVAAMESCPEPVSLLLQYGADVASNDSCGKTPLHLAFENRNYKIIDLLLSVANLADSNPVDARGISHFHIACSRNNENVVKNFIENGFLKDGSIPKVNESFNVSDWTGSSPLHFAVYHNKTNIVRLMLDSGSNVELKMSKGYTPLHIACQNMYKMFEEFIEGLLHDLNKHGKITKHVEPLTDVAAVDEKYAKFSEKIPAHENRSIEEIDWSTNRNDQINMMNILVNYGNDVNCIDYYGCAPLIYAYAAPAKIKSILKNNLYCSKSLWNEIVEIFSDELYERRKLIINNFH